MTSELPAMCSFSGGTIAAFCDRGCCGDSCCSTNATEGGATTYALIGVISALIFIFLVVVAIYSILKRKGYCQQRPDAETAKPWVPPPKKQDKKKKKSDKDAKRIKKQKIMALNAFTWAGKKKDIKKDSKDTQTGDFKANPGDVIKWAAGFWLPVKRDKNAPKLNHEVYKNVGVNTDSKLNNTKTINIEPKVNNIDVDNVPNVNVTPAVVLPPPRALPPPREVKPLRPRKAVPKSNFDGANYNPVKVPYDMFQPNTVPHPSGQGVLHSRGEMLAVRDNDSSIAKSVSLGASPHPSTPANPERQDTIEMLNEFTKVLMKKK